MDLLVHNLYVTVISVYHVYLYFVLCISNQESAVEDRAPEPVTEDEQQRLQMGEVADTQEATEEDLPEASKMQQEEGEQESAGASAQPDQASMPQTDSPGRKSPEETEVSVCVCL